MSPNPHEVVAHAATATALTASVLGYLPPILAATASLLAIIWYGCLIYEYFHKIKTK